MSIFEEVLTTKILRRDYKIRIDLYEGCEAKVFKEAVNKLPDDAKFLYVDFIESKEDKFDFDYPVILFRKEVEEND